MATFQVNRQQLVDLYVTLGYKSAPERDDKWLNMRLSDLKEDQDLDKLDAKQQKLLNDLFSAVENGDSLEFLCSKVSEDKWEDEEPSSKEKEEEIMSEKTEVMEETKEKEVKVKDPKETKLRKKEAVVKAKRTKDISPEVDDFGTKMGTAFQKANAVLSMEPKTMAQIEKEAGLSDTCYNHLNDLVKKNLIGKSKIEGGGKARWGFHLLPKKK